MADKNNKQVEGDTKLMRRALIGVLVAGSIFVAIYSIRAVASFVYWSDEVHQFQPIAKWMTPRYVAKSWQVPADVISDALDLELTSGSGRSSLEQLAESRGEDVTAIIEALDAAIAAHKAANP